MKISIDMYVCMFNSKWNWQQVIKISNHDTFQEVSCNGLFSGPLNPIVLARVWMFYLELIGSESIVDVVTDFKPLDALDIVGAKMEVVQ